MCRTARGGRLVLANQLAVSAQHGLYVGPPEVLQQRAQVCKRKNRFAAMCGVGFLSLLFLRRCAGAAVACAPRWGLVGGVPVRCIDVYGVACGRFLTIVFEAHVLV